MEEINYYAMINANLYTSSRFYELVVSQTIFKLLMYTLHKTNIYFINDYIKKKFI